MKASIAFVLIIALVNCSHSQIIKTSNNLKITSASDLNWESLNPARGDKSPKAATLWGDRKGEVSTGFLVKFVDGFSSPPHIHNVSYRGVVLEGLVHNDDPKSNNMWMPKVSYWTQPAGETHITSAEGKTTIAFIEIDKGPYLVKSEKNAFDSGERAFNMHASNIIWHQVKSAKIAYLWKNKVNAVTGSMIKFLNKIELNVDKVNVVLISGKMRLNKQLLNPGSFLSIEGIDTLKLSCETKTECTVYVKSEKIITVL